MAQCMVASQGNSGRQMTSAVSESMRRQSSASNTPHSRRIAGDARDCATRWSVGNAVCGHQRKATSNRTATPSGGQNPSGSPQADHNRNSKGQNMRPANSP